MKKEEMKISDLYSLENTMAKELLEQFTYPWEVLAHIGDFVERLGETLPKDEYANPAEGIWIHKSAHIAPTAGIIAPVIIGPEAEVRHCAFIRGKVIVGILASLPVGHIGLHAKQTVLDLTHRFVCGYREDIDGQHQVPA